MVTRSYCITLNHWRAVTAETGHATGVPKAGHAIGYNMGN